MSSSTQDPIPEADDHIYQMHLVVQAQAGDIAAFEKLYRQYYNRICTYILHIVGDDGVGCELTQETFLKVWQALPGLRQASAFEGWVYRIATNLAYDHQRRIKAVTWQPYHEAGKIKEIALAGPEELIEARELLKAALTSIKWKYRTCIILYHIEGFSRQRIAEILEIKESSVNTYLSTGLEQFRQNYIRLSARCTFFEKRSEGNE